MTLKQPSVVALSALMVVVTSPALPESPSVSTPPAAVDLCGAKLFPADASAYTGGPPVYIGHTADLERLTRTHPEDAAELRRALDALVNRSDDEVARVMIKGGAASSQSVLSEFSEGIAATTLLPTCAEPGCPA
jgi:hypothetical protein